MNTEEKKSKPRGMDMCEEKKEVTLPRVDLAPGTLLAPIPAALVTVGDMKAPNVLTVAWCGILSTNPARAYISVRPSRYSYKMLCESGEFVINLTTEELARATDYAGIYTGAKVDKFEKAGLLPVRSKCVGAPSLAESPLSLECHVFEVLEMGTHHVFMADIVNVSVRADIMDKEGKIRLDKAGLLAYAHGEYYALGKRVGKFGFSATKKKKSKMRRKGKSPKSAPSN